ncbi:MAG: hypothetical protein SGPRY_004946 [Prymnesium sp.]
MQAMDLMKRPREPLPQDVQGLQLGAVLAVLLCARLFGVRHPVDLLSNVLLSLFVTPWAVLVAQMMPVDMSRFWRLCWAMRLMGEWVCSRTYAFFFGLACDLDDLARRTALEDPSGDPIDGSPMGAYVHTA